MKRTFCGWVGCVTLLACGHDPEQVGSSKRAAPTPDSAPLPSAIVPATAAPEPLAPVTQVATVELPAAPKAPAPPASQCNEQTPQPFLAAAHFDAFIATGGSSQEWQQILNKAVRYRTEQYGYVKGFGKREWSETTPIEQASLVTFFGVSVSMHRKIAPALACVETAIRAECSDHPYQPYVLSGLRRRNTYLNGEVSNHIYGIALDVDPKRNPCCGCVGEWHDAERCQNDKNKFQRMDMPRCWVTQFERFGFYWLGHTKLEDTMHFEFLADPAQIVRQPELVR